MELLYAKESAGKQTYAAKEVENLSALVEQLRMYWKELRTRLVLLWQVTEAQGYLGELVHEGSSVCGSMNANESNMRWYIERREEEKFKRTEVATRLRCIELTRYIQAAEIFLTLYEKEVK